MFILSNRLRRLALCLITYALSLIAYHQPLAVVTNPVNAEVVEEEVF